VATCEGLIQSGNPEIYNQKKKKLGNHSQRWYPMSMICPHAWDDAYSSSLGCIIPVERWRMMGNA